jgi:hypothetical protein
MEDFLTCIDVSQVLQYKLEESPGVIPYSLDMVPRDALPWTVISAK